MVAALDKRLELAKGVLEIKPHRVVDMAQGLQLLI